MYCANCGHENRENANYCDNCGKSIGQAGDQSNERDTWETCEIVCQDVVRPPGLLFRPAVICFRADAIGPQGRYVAGYSADFSYPKQKFHIGIGFDPPAFVPGETDPDVKEALDQFVLDLAAEGWESTGGRGLPWFGFRFRRRAPYSKTR